MLFNKHTIRYLIAGGISFLSEYVLYAFFQHITHMVAVSAALSYGIVFFLSFLMARHWVFQAHSKTNNNVQRQAALYFSLAFFNFLVNIVAVEALYVNGVDALLAKPIVMVMIVSYNFFILQKVIFKTR